MAVQITSDNFERYFLNALAQFSDALEQDMGARGCEVVTDLETIKQVLSLPGVRYNANPITTPTAMAQAYVQIPYSILAQALEDMQRAASEASSSVDNVQTALDLAAADHTTATTDHTAATQDHALYSNDHIRAEGDHAIAASDHSQAATDHTACVNATSGANNVNAQLNGMTVTVTNRQGVSSSVNIGFEIYNTYSSVDEMNADASNVPLGKFVMIATTDPTSAENARLYGKNSQGGFTFLSDLDQASSEAWARWLNTYQPQIVQATNAANTAAGNAESKGNAAETAMNGIVTQWQGSDGNGGIKKEMNDVRSAVAAQGNAAEQKGDYAKAQGDYAKSRGDHTDEIRSDGYVYRYEPDNPTAGSDGYYRTSRQAGVMVDASTLTDEQIELAVSTFTFSSMEEGQNAIAGLR